MTQEEINAMAKEAGAPDWWSGVDDANVPGRKWLARFAALVAAKEREALLGDWQCAQVPLPMQVAARWPSVPGSHKYSGAGGCAPGSFGADSEDLFTTAKLLDYGDRRAAAAIRARGQKGGA